MQAPSGLILFSTTLVNTTLVSTTLAAMALGATCVAHADAVSDLDDAAARMQYAFHTADTRGVEEAIGIVGRLELPASWRGMKEYYVAYGQWKLAELHTDEVTQGRKGARADATKAASACVRAAATSTEQDERLAEAYAIKAICAALGNRTPEVLGFGNCARDKDLRTAHELDPNNPRIQLIEAQCMTDPDKASPPALIERLRSIVLAFEAAPPSRPGRPDWGQAEALLLLGQARLQRGEAVEARDLIERALVIAPDYRKARWQLDKARNP